MESELERWLPQPEGDSSRFFEALCYSTLGAGKRIRAALCVMTTEALGGDPSRALPAAAALECLHAYSLVHDDLPCIDNDEMRRGQPSSHMVFGEGMAVLAGDGLQALAYEILTEAYSDEPELGFELVKHLSHAGGMKGVVYGQALDITAGVHQSLADLEKLHGAKTTALLKASLLMGARCAGLQEKDERWEQLSQYADAIGLAFQLVDDILDASASSEELGKTAGKDKEQEKLSSVRLLGLEGAQEKANALLNEALAALRSWDSSAEPLRQIAQYIVRRRS